MGIAAGERLANRYEVRSVLGEGGLGTAFRVHDLVFGADVALKLVARGTETADVLRREFLALRAGPHPRLQRVYDFGYCRQGAFYTSALVAGSPLDVWARGRSWAALRPVVGDLLAALASLHVRGMVHGDVHPNNVFVEEGRGVLLDLSCARPFGESAVELSGTPGFLAPELRRGIVGRGADLYALGVTLDLVGEVLDGGLPASVKSVVAKLRAAAPEARPRSAEETRDLLDVAWEAPRLADRLGTRLVGRDEARAVLAEGLRALAERAPGERVFVLRGDDGTGRSRLLEETKTDAQLGGAAILSPARPGAVGRVLRIALGGDVEPRGAAAVLDATERLASRDEPLALFLDDVHELSEGERADLGVLLRSVPRDGALLVCVASRTSITAAARELELGPLDVHQVRAWLGREVPETGLAMLTRATGGHPKRIAAVLASLDEGVWDARVAERVIASTGGGGVDLEGLDVEARRALAVLAAGGALAATGAEPALVRRRLVLRDPDGLRIAPHLHMGPLRVALGEEAMRAAHRELAEAARAAADEPRRIRHLAAVDLERAVALFVGTSVEPSLLRAAADALAEQPVDAAVLARCATVYNASGEPPRALALVTRALRRRPPAERRDELRKAAGLAYARMGDPRRAVVALRRVRAADAETASALSLALLKRGADVEAMSVAKQALAGPGLAPALRLDLTLSLVFAASRRGDLEEARSLLERARRAAEGDVPPRVRHRLLSARAFIAYGAGEVTAAAAAYEEALAVAERHGLDDLLAPAFLNYGSACHERGDLGRALEAYERGRRLARALGMPTTEATLAFDVAKVYADVGCFDRAAVLAEKARLAARSERMPLLEAGACAVLAEVAQVEGQHDACARRLDEAESLARGHGERDELVLVLQRAKARVAAGDATTAERLLDTCALRANALGDEAEASWLVARALVALARGDARSALVDLERAAPLAERSGQQALVAELEARRADAYAGTPFLAERHRARAREIWERTLATLPPDLHGAFREHPVRRATFGSSEKASGAPPALDMRRILEINRRLVSATTTSAVLEETMDAAIGLTNAERGFLLVSGESLRVAVARNIDRENLRHGHLKFSRTVAERVVRTGEPVVSVDAAFDPRFAKSRSVHAMRLKSVLSVPIRAEGAILGAIYVDQRFAAGGFRPELTELLLALADQAALALVKARLVDDLRKKTAELEERNAEVEQLARGQAVEIARLRRTLEDEDRVRAAAPRYDYGDIVADSAPMRRVLSVLDRVIDADVTVLVRGESGTGKERVARAIHANSGRRGGPFVAINCGALPESLLEAELFGYRRGAFSGATRDQPGLFVSARGGTLFLDELGEMPPAMQVKLLRVLQEREVRPLGSNEALSTDVRLVCATNRVLREEVLAGRFREDLYYRVAVVEVELPPLRDRIEDLLPIAGAILDRLARDLARPRPTLERGAERALLAHAWPGNVRELENVLTKAFLLARGPVLGADDLELGTSAPRRPSARAALRARIQAALDQTEWNVVLASRVLGIPRATLYRKMRLLGMVRPERSAD